jgi:hypothetical protein
MSSRPACKIIPTAKLTADNAGDVELTAHRKAIAAAVAPQPQSTPAAPSSESDPLVTTLETATDTTSDLVAPTSSSSKRPRARPLMLAASLKTLADDTDSDDTPKAKKTKVTPRQAGSGLQGDVSIIEIDDGDDQNNEPLNKISPSADIQAFFKFHSEETDSKGEVKVFMKCTPCR